MRLRLFILSIVVLFSYVGFVVAGEHPGHGEHKGSMTEHHEGKEGLIAIRVNNKICPVSGENVGTMGDRIEREYNGKIYNLCCPSCAKVFEKDPEKYSNIAEEEVANEKEKGSHAEHKGSHHVH